MNWQKLREKYFKECVENGKVCYAPHDLFEWFKRETGKCESDYCENETHIHLCNDCHESDCLNAPC